MNTGVEIEVINEVLIQNAFKATFYSNGIVEIAFDNSVDVVTKEHILKIREVLRTVGGEKKLPLYFSLHDFIHISEDARNYIATEESATYTLANAVLIDNLAKKIVLNFVLRFNKPTTPVKAFTSKEAAFEWLEQFEPTKL